MYVGHSQGTTQMFTALAEGHGQLDQKLSLFVALAPITHLIGAHNPLFKSLSTSVPVIKSILEYYKIFELYGQGY